LRQRHLSLTAKAIPELAGYGVVVASGEHRPRDEGDRWVLPTGEGIVTQLRIDFAFGFTIEQWLHLRISEPFVVESEVGPIRCDPEREPQSMGRLVDLHQAIVRIASVYKDGSLAVAFRDGRRLRVSPASTTKPSK